MAGRTHDGAREQIAANTGVRCTSRMEKTVAALYERRPRNKARLGGHRPPLQQRLTFIAQSAVHNASRRSEWVRLGFVGVKDMHDCDPARFQIIGNERTMAAPPDCFCAHDRS